MLQAHQNKDVIVKIRWNVISEGVIFFRVNFKLLLKIE